MPLFKRRKKLQVDLREPEDYTAEDEIPVVPFEADLPSDVEDKVPSIEEEARSDAEEEPTETEDISSENLDTEDLDSKDTPSGLKGISFITDTGDTFDGPQLIAEIDKDTPRLDISVLEASGENGLSLEKPEYLNTTENRETSHATARKIKNLSESKIQLELKIEERDKRIQALRGDIIHISTQLDETHTLLSQTRNQLSVTTATIETRDVELREALKASAALSAQIRQNESEARLKEANSQALQRELAKAHNHLSKMKALRTALTRAETGKTALAERLRTAHETITAYERRMDKKILDYQIKIKAQQAQIAELKTEIASNKVLMSETAQSVTHIRSSFSDKEEDYVRLQHLVTEQLATISQTEAKLQKSLHINDVLKKRLAKTISEYQPASFEVPDIPEHIEKDLATLKAQNAELKKRLEQSLARKSPTAPAPATQELDALREKNANLQIQLEQASSAMNADDLARLQQIIVTQKQELREAERQLAAQRAETLARDQRYAEISQALDQARLQLATQPPAREPDIRPYVADDEDFIKLSDDDDAFEDTDTKGLTNKSIEDMIMDFKLGNSAKLG